MTRVATIVTRLAGGAGVMALRGALALPPSQYEITLVTGELEETSSARALVDAAERAGVEVVVEPALRSPIAPTDDLAALGRLTALLRRRSFDVVHTHCAKAGAVGRMAAHRTGVPRIVHTFHGFPFHEFQSPARRQAYVWIERRLGRLTDMALCVGAGVSVEAIRRRLLPPERVRTIGVAVDTGAPTRTPESRERARRALGLPADATVVAAVGRLTYQKAPEDFVAVLDRLTRSGNHPDVVGVWVGAGERADRVRELADRTLPQLVLTGDRVDVPDLLPAFDVFVLPSRYEGVPLAAVEAMMCGVPVVATAVNAVADVVVPGETGLLVPPRRPDLLAAAVRHMLDSPLDAARMAEAGRARVREHHGERALGEALAAAYDGRGRHALTQRPSAG